MSLLTQLRAILPRDYSLESVCSAEERGEVPVWLWACLRGVQAEVAASFSGGSLSGEALPLLDMAEDFVWERLNSGHWKDVALHWRKLFAFVLFLKVCVWGAEEGNGTAEVARICDSGLLMGCPILGNVLGRVAALLHRQAEGGGEWARAQRQPPSLPLSTPVGMGLRLDVPSLHSPSLDYFSQHHFRPHRPALLTRAIVHWPAFAKWTPQHIAQVYGRRTVPVEIGSQYTAEDWRQELMTIEAFVEEYMSDGGGGGPIAYLAQHPLFDQIPELREDIVVPEYTCLGEEGVEINAWFGPAGTTTPTHFDPKHNFLGQVFGRKWVRLFRPEEGVHLEPHADGSLLSNTSTIDMDAADVLLRHPQLGRVEYSDVLLEAGSLLYLPPRWWHMVKALSPSFSVSFWWG